ncbi:MAG: hypothetical protein AB7F43_02920 [Bacteriovoracia bacterium]
MNPKLERKKNESEQSKDISDKAPTTMTSEEIVIERIEINLEDAVDKSEKIDANVEVVEFETDVLFQKIFNKWYSFTAVGEDCIISAVPENQVLKHYKRRIIRPAS